MWNGSEWKAENVKIRVKCLNDKSSNSLFTVGKIYTGKTDVLDGMKLIANDGQEWYCRYSKCCCFGCWELIEDSAEEPKIADKNKIWDAIVGVFSR